MNSVRLTNKEEQILSILECNPDFTYSQIAKEVGARNHTVQYAVKKLESLGIINKLAYLNIYSLGIEYYGFYLSIVIDNNNYKRLNDYIAKDSQIAWVAELAGEFNYGIAIIAKNSSEALTVLSKLIKTLNIRITKKQVAHRISLTDIPKNFFGSKNSKKFKYNYKISQTLEKQTLSILENSVLRQLAIGRIDSLHKIAEKLGIADSTLNYQLNQLKQKGTFIGFKYEINSSLLGKQQFKLLVYCNYIKTAMTERLLKVVLASTYAHHFIEAFGSWDYEINVDVNDAQQLFKVTQELYTQFPNEIVEIKTLCISKVLKFCQYA